MPKVSIIIPIYNTEQYLERCLISIVNQTFKDIEIICINDGSYDNSGQILDKYAKTDSRIKVINSENCGLSSARNKGINIAEGKYCYFIDSDDEIDINTIEKMVNIMEKTDVDVAVHGVANIIQDENLTNNPFICSQKYFDNKSKPSGIYEVPIEINKAFTNVVWNKLYKLEIVNKFHCSFPEKLIYEDEFFLWDYMLHCKKYYYLEDKLYYYYRRQNSVTGLLNKSNKPLDKLKILNLIYNKVKEQKDINKYKNYLTEKYISSTKTLFKRMNNKYKKEALEHIKNYYETTNPDKRILKLYKQYKYEKLRNFVDGIFSVKNSEDKRRKIITILGLKIKIKQKIA